MGVSKSYYASFKKQINGYRKCGRCGIWKDAYDGSLAVDFYRGQDGSVYCEQCLLHLSREYATGWLAERWADHYQKLVPDWVQTSAQFNYFFIQSIHVSPQTRHLLWMWWKSRKA